MPLIFEQDNKNKTKMKPTSIVLLILFISYIVLSPPIPALWAPFLTHPSGKVVLFLIILGLFATHHPLLSIIAIFVAMELLQKAQRITNPYPYELKYYSPYSPNHQFPYTLEQEMVKLRTPVQPKEFSPPTFHPMLENTYDASPV